MITVIQIPGEPVAKGRPRFTSKGHAYTPGRTKAYEEVVASYGRIAMGPNPPYFCELDVSITAFFPLPKSWTNEKKARALGGQFRAVPADIDNIAKSVLDGLQGVAFADDKQIVTLHVFKGYAYDPSTIVRIEPVHKELDTTQSAA